MARAEFECLATTIGSMPHTDPQKACSLITTYTPAIPAWPQLPKRSFLENMYAQFSEGFPGITIENSHIYVNRSAKDFDNQLEQLYNAYLENNPNNYNISPEYASGLYTFLKLEMEQPKAIKGQITGPVSWGLTITDKDRRGILYDETLNDAIAKFLKLKALWQEQTLSRLSPNTIIFIDEPYMTSFGSAFLPLSREQIINPLEEVLSGIKGFKGVHCCGNTDWTLLLETSTDILSFDAYNYAQSFSLYPAEIKSFLKRGGNIAWGIVPNDEEALTKETVASLRDRLEEAMALLSREGISFRQVLRQALLTPSCGLAPLSPDAATLALELLSELSNKVRKKYIT